MNKTTNQSNDAWIKTIEKMVLEELKEPLPEIEVMPKKLPAKKIAGFTVENPETIMETSVNLQAKNMNKKATAFQLNASGFRIALEAQDVQAIGIIPVGIWEAICKKFTLYRFEHLHKGITYAPASAANRIDEIASSFRFSALSSAVTALLVWLGYLVNPFLGWAHPASHELAYAILLIAAFPLSLLTISLTKNMGAALTIIFPAFITTIAAMIYYFDFSSLAGLILMAACMLIILIAYDEDISERDLMLVGKRRLLRILFPENTDCEKSDNEQELKISPIFPTPDKDFRELLIKLENNEHKLCVAAEPKAIRIALPELAANMREYIVKRDPILYVKSADGKLIAVLGQFGRFKKEKQAIKMVRRMRIREIL